MEDSQHFSGSGVKSVEYFCRRGENNNKRRQVHCTLPTSNFPLSATPSPLCRGRPPTHVRHVLPLCIAHFPNSSLHIYANGKPLNDANIYVSPLARPLQNLRRNSPLRSAVSARFRQDLTVVSFRIHALGFFFFSFFRPSLVCSGSVRLQSAMQDPGGEVPLNSMLAPCNRPLAGRRLRSHPSQVLKCPRCDSLNTKFCYYNNYNLSQPRHYCKNCRRYWTKGGVLRNVPVGGGCRKNKRSKAPRNPDHRGSPRKCASNSTTTVSSENSTVTVAVQEASSAPNSGGVRAPDGESLESFDQETLVHQILSMPDPLRLDDTVNCDALTYGGSGPETAVPRLLSGLATLDYGLLDWQIPAQSLGNWLSDGANSDSNPYGSLIHGSSPAGFSFSDLQWMLQQQQPKMEDLCLEGRGINNHNTNNINNAAASEWQPGYHSEVLNEMAADVFGYGMAGIGGSDQKPLRLP